MASFYTAYRIRNRRNVVAHNYCAGFKIRKVQRVAQLGVVGLLFGIIAAWQFQLVVGYFIATVSAFIFAAAGAIITDISERRRVLRDVAKIHGYGGGGLAYAAGVSDAGYFADGPNGGWEGDFGDGGDGDGGGGDGGGSGGDGG